MTVAINKPIEVFIQSNFGIKTPQFVFAAMGNYGGSVSDFKDSTLYTTLFPCLSCSKLLSTLGVKKIVYLNARKECDEFIYASILFKKAGTCF